MFAKHLPPSAGSPRVLALDDSAAAELPAEVERIDAGRRRSLAPGQLDAVAGYAAPDQIKALVPLLRPGGRLILAQRAGTWPAASLLAALTSAGLIHCLVEPVGEAILYRGERPQAGSSVERVPSLAAPSAPSTLPRFVFLLVTQTPNKPAWKLDPAERVEWRAATLLDPTTGEPALLAFSSLVKAVAFMQAAILAGWIEGVNKVGKFRAQAARRWELPLRLDPAFDEVRSDALGPPFGVDSQAALTGEE
jgi:hypothetical protein